MRCSCGTDCSEKAIYCPKCGKQIRCLSCGSELFPGAMFCAKCGKSLVQTPVVDHGQIDEDKEVDTLPAETSGNTDNGTKSAPTPVVDHGQIDRDEEMDMPLAETSGNTDNKTAGAKKSKKGLIAIACVIAAVVLVLLLTNVFGKKNITGVWKLKSGSFVGYDLCALDFRDNGEFILYTGDLYTRISERGSYSNDNKQITLISDGMRFYYNYSVNGNDLSVVSSSGTANFMKMNVNGEPSSFNESVLAKKYIDDAYTVSDLILVSQDRTSRTYQYTISKSHKYAEEIQQIEEQYLYSLIAGQWYMESSNVIGRSNNWDVNGVWKTNGGITLVIYSFSDDSVTYDYTSDYHHYSETTEVHKSLIDEDGYYFFIDYQPNVIVQDTMEVYYDRDIYEDFIGVFHRQDSAMNNGQTVSLPKESSAEKTDKDTSYNSGTYDSVPCFGISNNELDAFMQTIFSISSNWNRSTAPQYVYDFPLLPEWDLSERLTGTIQYEDGHYSIQKSFGMPVPYYDFGDVYWIDRNSQWHDLKESGGKWVTSDVVDKNLMGGEAYWNCDYSVDSGNFMLVVFSLDEDVSGENRGTLNFYEVVNFDNGYSGKDITIYDKTSSRAIMYSIRDVMYEETRLYIIIHNFDLNYSLTLTYSCEDGRLLDVKTNYNLQ